MIKKPLILITNDDGIDAPGINHLINVASTFGEVWVVAPNSPQSGKGHAVTVEEPVFCKSHKLNNKAYKSFSISGTPADCVKLGLNEILPKRPNLCISGINHGSNASINCIYSGTVAGAIEASLQGIPSIAFSLLDFSWNANFKKTTSFIEKIISFVLNGEKKTYTTLNVNFPLLKEKEEFKGIKFCRQSKAMWKEDFEKRFHPTKNKEYYWMLGDFENLEKNSKDTDLWFLKNNYISIVPLKHDLTDYLSLEKNINLK